MSKRSCTPLTQAARVLGSHPAALRKTINRFGIIERDGRQRVIPNDILALFRRTRAASGYLYPAWVRTHDDLIAAVAEIPAGIRRSQQPRPSGGGPRITCSRRRRRESGATA
jgi:hypothetical protein